MSIQDESARQRSVRLADTQGEQGFITVLLAVVSIEAFIDEAVQLTIHDLAHDVLRGGLKEIRGDRPRRRRARLVRRRASLRAGMRGSELIDGVDATVHQRHDDH